MARALSKGGGRGMEGRAGSGARRGLWEGWTVLRTFWLLDLSDVDYHRGYCFRSSQIQVEEAHGPIKGLESQTFETCSAC